MSDPFNDPVDRQSPSPRPTRPATVEQVRARQRSRAIVTAVLLGAFVVLVFAISIARMKHG